MRPEYVDAINAVRWGPSLWLSLGVPGLTAWLVVFASKSTSAKSYVQIACVSIAVSGAFCWALVVWHGNRIQAAKKDLMQTDAEMADWAADTWLAFAPFTAVPYALVYCTLATLLAMIVHALVHKFRRIDAHAA